MINYKLLCLLYLPILFLILISLLTDRFKYNNSLSDPYSISLKPAIIILTFMLSNFLIQSLWYRNPILGYQYSQFRWEVIVLFWNLAVLILLFIIFRLFLKISLVDTFNLSITYLPSILKICGILSIPVILSVSLSGVDLSYSLQKEDLAVLKSMSISHFVLFSINTILLVPIVEEAVFRGLIYIPLYRKLGRNVAMLSSSLLFTYSHFAIMTQNFVGSIVIFLKGLFLVWLYDRKATLIYPIVFHAFLNIWFIYSQWWLIH